MTVATLTSKWQITIPKQVREHLKLNPGDNVIALDRRDFSRYRTCTRRAFTNHFPERT